MATVRCKTFHRILACWRSRWATSLILAAIPFLSHCRNDSNTKSRVRNGLGEISKTGMAQEQFISQFVPDAIELKEDEGIQIPITGIDNSETKPRSADSRVVAA